MFDVTQVGATLRQMVLEGSDARESLIDLSHAFPQVANLKDIPVWPTKEEVIEAHEMPADHSQAVAELGKWLEQDLGRKLTHVAEIGVFHGDTTIVLAKTFPTAIIDAVDHFQGTPDDPMEDLSRLAGGPDVLAAAFKQRIKSEGLSNVALTRRPSTEAASLLSG